MTRPDEKITLTTEQLDDLLKRWKRKGAERALAFAFVASIPAAIAGGLFPAIAPDQAATACAAYYCTVAALAALTS